MTKIRVFTFAALAVLAIGGAAAVGGDACAQGQLRSAGLLCSLLR
jgi:hypothetical protein